jgi:capsular polysaccharide biosynthesis protein
LSAEAFPRGERGDFSDAFSACDFALVSPAAADMRWSHVTRTDDPRAVSATKFLAPPERCEHLEAIARRCGGEVRVRGGPQRVEYRPPSHLDPRLRALFAGDASREVAPVIVAELPEGRVYGHGNVLSPDGASVARDVSEDFGKPFDDHWLLTYPRMRPPGRLPGKTAVVATTLGAGYGHWLLEELPRLLSADLRGCDHLIAHGEPAFARIALARLGFRGRILEARRDRHWSCERLVVPGLLSRPGFPSPETIMLLGAFAEGLRGDSSGCGERLYVSRAKARRRRVLDEALLWAALEARGFRRLFLEEMSWPEQIVAFSRARVVVSPHGAGLANSVFCRPGARIVELFHHAYVNLCHGRVASLKGLEYRAVVDAPEMTPGLAVKANRHDVAVAVERVLAELA